jgi:arylsulfatase A-like enzyme
MPDERPNFIVILTDDQGYGDLGCYGSAELATPRIDRMADEGVRLTDFYMAGAVCTPSRAALMTGRYAQRVGLPGVLFPSSLPELADTEAGGIGADEVTIAELLREAGYATTCIGKWHLGDRAEHLPTRHGFDSFFGLPYSNDMHPPNSKRPYSPLPLMRNERVVETDPDQDLLTRRYTDEALRFIIDNRERPFFLYLAHSMPHRPLHASEPFLTRIAPDSLAKIQGEDRSRDILYPAVIEELDRSTGEILDALDELGIGSRTLVVFTSDNGPTVGGLGSAGPLRGRKGSMFEGGLRVPCVMRWPGRIPAGSVRNQVCTAMDLLPTFAHLAGAQPPSDRVMDGRNIWPVVSGDPTAQSPHSSFFYFSAERLYGVRSGRWKLLWERQCADEQDRWCTGATVRRALFDLESDPGESIDLADRHPDLTARLEATIERFEGELRQDASYREADRRRVDK